MSQKKSLGHTELEVVIAQNDRAKLLERLSPRFRRSFPDYYYRETLGWVVEIGSDRETFKTDDFRAAMELFSSRVKE